jgi:hypothetical protein
MSDFRSDPNFPQREFKDSDMRVQWAAVAVILLLVGGLIVAAAWSGADTQTASNGTAIQSTTGSAPADAGPMPKVPPQLRR